MAFTGVVSELGQALSSPNAALGHSTTAMQGGAAFVVRRSGNWEVIGEPVVITFHVNKNAVLETTGATLFVARGKSYKVVNVDCSWTVVDASTTINFKLERCQGTEAAAAGDDLLAATAVNVKATKDTVVSPSIITTSAIDVLASGDRLVAHFANDAASAIVSAALDGFVCTVKLVPVTVSTANDS